MAHITLKNVDFRYPIFDLTNRSLKVTLLRQVVGSTIEVSKGRTEVHALQNVSLEFGEGARIGLIGRNGSGKSTLLRLLAGLAHPQSGVLSMSGRVVPLIERGLGVNPELTGMQNIELPLLLLGATNAEITRAKEAIPEWTGLGNFMHMPYRTYSEGMKARLMFAISTALDADILLLDEWLGAGDADFVDRAEARMTQMLERTAIVVLASHSTGIIEKICNVVCWMDCGRVVMVGEPGVVLGAYAQHSSAPNVELPISPSAPQLSALEQNHAAAPEIASLG